MRSRRPDLELIAGASAHYDDPAYYDQAYGDRRHDIGYYCDVARGTGAVLELGCGSGRVALALARQGNPVDGIDLSKPMLAAFRKKLGTQDESVRRRVRIRRGDMRSYRVERRYPLVICPFNGFLHLYERRDVERCLDRIRRSLTREGRFVFDVTVPDPDELASDPTQPYRMPRFDYPGVGMVRYAERFDYDPLRQILFMSFEFTPARGEPWTTPLAHRQFFPEELRALLACAGFDVLRVDADFTRDALPTASTQTLVYHCRASRRRR